MERQSLIDEKQKITLADEKSGVLKVDLIQVVGRGGTAIAYKGIQWRKTDVYHKRIFSR